MTWNFSVAYPNEHNPSWVNCSEFCIDANRWVVIACKPMSVLYPVVMYSILNGRGWNRFEEHKPSKNIEELKQTFSNLENRLMLFLLQKYS